MFRRKQSTEGTTNREQISRRLQAAGRPDAVAKSRQADAALHANQAAEKAAGIREETPEYLELNAAANEAAAELPWWRR